MWLASGWSVLGKGQFFCMKHPSKASVREDLNIAKWTDQSPEDHPTSGSVLSHTFFPAQKVMDMSCSLGILMPNTAAQPAHTPTHPGGLDETKIKVGLMPSLASSPGSHTTQRQPTLADPRSFFFGNQAKFYLLESPERRKSKGEPSSGNLLGHIIQ